MTYLEIREAVESALARTDIPTYIYTLVVKEINARLRIRELEITAAFAASAGQIYVELPVTVRKIVHAYLGTDGTTEADGSFSDGFSTGFELTTAGAADVIGELEQTSDFVLSAQFVETGRPTHFALLTDSDADVRMRLNPVPDIDYTVIVSYLAGTADMVQDSDETAMMSRYPTLYLYSALKHAAIWAQDMEMAQGYAAVFEGEVTRLIKQDRVSRYSGPLVSVRG